MTAIVGVKMSHETYHVITRTKRRRTSTVWGREGKPASLKMWVLLAEKRLRCWAWNLCTEQLIQLEQLPQVWQQRIFKKYFLHFLTGGGIQRRSWRQAVHTGCPVGKKDGLLLRGKPQQSQGHGDPAARKVWGKRSSTANRTQATGGRESCGSFWFHSSGSEGREGAFPPLKQTRHRIGIQAFCTVIVVLWTFAYRFDAVWRL